MESVYRYQLTATPEMTDGNRHVNNVVYLKWMQDAAIQHAEKAGCNRIAESMGASWVVRTHRIEYFTPAFPGDAITVVTWVANMRKVRSVRRYKILRNRDNTLMAEGETDWVFVDAVSGRPRSIPQEIADCFVVVEDPVP